MNLHIVIFNCIATSIRNEKQQTRLGSKKRRSTIVPPCILVLPLDWICSFAPFGLKAVQDQFLSGLRQENMW